MTDSPARNRVLICDTCERAGSAPTAAAEVASLRAALAEAGLAEAFSVSATSCLGGCEAPVCLSVQGAGRAVYVFSELDIAALEGDIAAFCRMYLEADRGWIEDARPAGALRFHLRARVPAV